MANLLHATRFQSPNPAVNPVTVTIPATSAGSTLVCIVGGGAIIQAHLGGSGGTSFTKRISSLNNREVSAQDVVDTTGGTTTITFTLNGAENIDGVIYEFASGSLGAFATGATESSPGGNTTSDHLTGQTKIGTITTSGPTVLFTMFTSGELTTSPAPMRQFWGVEPIAKQYFNGFNEPDSSASKYWSLIAVSAQSSAGTFDAASSRAVQNLEHQSIVAAYTDNQPGTATYPNPYANYVAAENSRPGSLYETWYGASTNANIAGYTDSLSYSPGDTVQFHVDTNNNGFAVEVSRFGYYGYLLFGGKQVATVAGTPTTQPAPTIDTYGGTVCNWSTTASWTIPANATPGIYVYNMRRSDVPANVAQGIFVVRNTTPASFDSSRMMVVTADFTWQAYNAWGATSDTGGDPSGFTGRNLYGQAPTVPIGTRSFAVSYDRPMGTVGNGPSTYFWDSEGALINFLEGNGYPVDYYTMVDIEKDPTIPAKYGIAIVSGHSEYWTSNLRNAFENARDSSTNLMFFSSNTSLWHARFDPTDTNKRRLICYKDSHDTTGWDNTTKYDPIAYTGTWRDDRTVPGGVNNTSRRPESGMTGLWFIGNGQFEDTLVIPNSYRAVPMWRSTKFANNVSIAVGGTTTSTLGAAGTSISLNQPASTLAGDLMMVVLTFNGDPGGFNTAGCRLIRSITDSSQSTIVMVYQALSAGTTAEAWTWATPCMASGIIIDYQNAVLNDSDMSLSIDLGGAATHTTDSIIPGSNDRWAVCVFADSNTTGTSKTTSWTAGAGLTSRAQVNNASGSGPWNSLAVMDTNSAVTQAAHQYSATAQFGNSHATTCILYISPGQAVTNGHTIGYEWDYLKADEPSTPTNLVRLSDQIFPLTHQAASYNGDSYNENGLLRYGLILYKAGSGAMVFNTGSWHFAYGVSRFRRSLLDSNGDIDIDMQQATLNIIRDLGIPPTTILGTVGNNHVPGLVDPGSARTSAQYGLTLTNPGYQSIFGSTVPTVPDNAQASDTTMGTVFTASGDGQIYGIRWYFPQTLPNKQVIGLLYDWTSDTTGAELARATAVNIQTGWNTITFSTPVSISANIKYVAAVWTLDRGVYTLGGLNSAVTNGPLTAPADVGVAHNGKFLSGNGGPALPTSSGAGTNYLVDVLYVGSGTIAGFEGWGFPIN